MIIDCLWACGGFYLKQGALNYSDTALLFGSKSRLKLISKLPKHPHETIKLYQPKDNLKISHDICSLFECKCTFVPV